MSALYRLSNYSLYNSTVVQNSPERRSFCRKNGSLIPLYAEGEGPCAGGEWNLTDASTAEAEPQGAEELPPAVKTLHQWLHALRKDGLVMVSFISGIISGVISLFAFCYMYECEDPNADRSLRTTAAICLQ